jgi:hypothetical protein
MNCTNGIKLFAAGVLWLLTPNAVSAAKPPMLRLTGAQKVSAPDHYRLEFEVVNPNDRQRLPYLGFLANSFDPPLKSGEIAPWYVIQTKVAGSWNGKGPIFCKMGIGSVSLAPGSNAIFPVYTTGPVDWDAIRIGIRWSTDTDIKAKRDWKMVWSEPFARKTIASAAKQTNETLTSSAPRIVRLEE